MVKASLVIMLVLTVLFSFGLRWREQRMTTLRPPPRGARAEGWVAAQKRKFNRWTTAATLAALTTLIVLGGLHWLRVWQAG